jgi:hypothetical protein
MVSLHSTQPLVLLLK